MNASSPNEAGLEIGFPVPDFKPPPRPDATILQGRFCTLEPLDADRHAASLHEANGKDIEGRIWTYLPYGPFQTLADYSEWVSTQAAHDDPWFYAIIDNRTGTATGVASYLRINPGSGSIETGHIDYSPSLQNTPAATEAMYLMMKNIFDLGYRRYEWKCDALNRRSCNAASRLGFVFEGIFRQATIYKNRNRDTAWFSVIDREWPALKSAFQRWLNTDNFDADGQQLERLSSLTGQLQPVNS